MRRPANDIKNRQLRSKQPNLRRELAELDERDPSGDDGEPDDRPHRDRLADDGPVDQRGERGSDVAVEVDLDRAEAVEQREVQQVGSLRRPRGTRATRARRTSSESRRIPRSETERREGEAFGIDAGNNTLPVRCRTWRRVALA